MNTMTKGNRLFGKMRGTALAVALAGATLGAVAVPALAQETVTTTRTVRSYDSWRYDPDYYPTTTYYYRSGPVYYDDWGYSYPPPPAYDPYYGPGVTVGIPGLIGLHVW